MTCRGYDIKAIKISKSVKRLAANIIDDHVRGAFIRDYVRIAEANRQIGKSKKDKKD